MKKYLIICVVALICNYGNAAAQTSRTSLSRNTRTSNQTRSKESSTKRGSVTIDLMSVIKKAAENKNTKESKDAKKNRRETIPERNEGEKATFWDDSFGNKDDNKKAEKNLSDVGTNNKTAPSQQKRNESRAADDISLVVDGEGYDKTDATKNALRSAIEQAYGVFVSASTEILNDDLVKDEIATVASGNIKSYNELSSRMLPNGNISVTLSTIVSIGKLVSYSKSKGSSAEFAGQSFMMEMRMIELNKENESIALAHLQKECESIDQSIYDCQLILGDAMRSNAIISKWSDVSSLLVLPNVGKEYTHGLPVTNGYIIPITLTISGNKNYNIWLNRIISVLEALSLSAEDLKMLGQHNIPFRHLILNKKSYYFRSDSDVLLKLTGTIANQINSSALSWEIEEKGVGNRYHPIRPKSSEQVQKETIACVISQQQKMSDTEMFMRGISQPSGKEHPFRVPHVFDGFWLENSEKDCIIMNETYNRVDVNGFAQTWKTFNDDIILNLRPDRPTNRFPFELFYTAEQLSTIQGFDVKMVPMSVLPSENNKGQMGKTESSTPAETSHSTPQNSQSSITSPSSLKKPEYPVTVFSDPAIDALPSKEMEPMGFNKADSAPRFNGGDLQEFRNWVSSVLQYPEKEKNEGVGGLVYVQFTISSEGIVQDVKIKRGVTSSIDAEAVRVVSLSPKWVPATKDGYRIPVSIVFPIAFQLR